MPAGQFSNQAPMVEITVSDNGPGISNVNLGKLFEPYFTTRAPGQGTGLGLSIVQRLVFQADGAIFLETHEGQGSVFKIYLAASTRH